MKTIRTVVLACAVALPALSGVPLGAQETQQDNTGFGGAAGEFLLLGAGARGMALGGAFSALTTDITALYYNPGGLAQLDRPGAVVSVHDYLADTRYAWLGTAFRLGGGTRAIGISLGSFGFGDQPIYEDDDPDGNSGRTYSVRETFLSATYAQNFSDRFSAGLSLKFIRDELGSAEGSAVAVDFGTNFHASIGDRPIRASFVIQNLANLKHSGEDLEVGVTREPPQGTVDVPQEPQSANLNTTAWTLPIQFRVGLAFDALRSGMNRVSVLAEFTQPSNTKPGASAGLEWMAANVGGGGFSFAARGSYTINPDNDESDINYNGVPTQESTGSFTSDGLALGGGITYASRRVSVGFDYAWRDMGLLGNTNFLTFTIGWGARNGGS
jgi:hypothetical protein